MKLTITIHLDNRPLTLPVAHHHILYSIFKDLAGDKLDIHDEGYHYGKRNYKLFTFGPIVGNKRHYDEISKKISFYSEITIEFRAWNPEVVRAVKENIESKGIRFGENIYTDISCETMEGKISADSIVIDMLSPICVYKTYESIIGGKKKRTKYFVPDTEEFKSAIVDNFRRKYSAATGQEPIADICFETVKFNRKTDKEVTFYMKTNKETGETVNNVIEAYNGIYRLKGMPEYLTFLYDTGLGAKNSAGFGMFRVL